MISSLDRSSVQLQMASSRAHLVAGVLLLAISLCCASAASQDAVNETGHGDSTEEGSHNEPPPEVAVAELRFHEIEVIMIVVGFIMAVVLAKIREWRPLMSVRLCVDM